MKEKYRFFSYWFLLGSMILFMLLSLGGTIIMIWVLVSLDFYDQTVYKFIGLGICLLSFVTSIYVFCKYAFQWTTLDAIGVRTKCLLGNIHKFTWDEIKEVIIEKLPVSTSWGFKAQWILIKDGRTNMKPHNYVIKKDTYITIKYSKKALEALQKFWDKEILENEITD